MTRKDYIRIARAIKEAKERAERQTATPDNIERVQQGMTSAQLAVSQSFHGLGIELARELKADNGNFDESRFLQACGI